MSRSQKNIEQQRSLVCQWTECGKTFKSITGRKIHEKVNRQNRQEETNCEWCNTAIGEKTSLTGDHKFCTGAPKAICPYCGETKSVASMAGHRKSRALINERKDNLTEEEANIQKEKIKTERKGDTIACENLMS